MRVSQLRHWIKTAKAIRVGLLARPSHAAKSRPFAKAAPLPIAARRA